MQEWLRIVVHGCATRPQRVRVNATSSGGFSRPSLDGAVVKTTSLPLLPSPELRRQLSPFTGHRWRSQARHGVSPLRHFVIITADQNSIWLDLHCSDLRLTLESVCQQCFYGYYMLVMEVRAGTYYDIAINLKA